MKKIRNILFIVVFIAICATPLAGAIFGYENKSTEKRELSIAPSFIVDASINAEFTQQFDDYFTDNFAFRPELITAYAYAKSGVLLESVSDKVIVGKDGWLFFVPTLSDYQGAEVMSDNEIYRLFKTLDIKQKYLADKGIDFIFTIAPNKSSLYGEFMPKRYKILDEQNNADKLYAMLDSVGFDYVNLYSALQSEEQLYHKTDTHWNNKGAMAAYNALLGEVQRGADVFDYNTYQGIEPVLTLSHIGDLTQMLYPVSDIKDAQYNYGVEQEYSFGRSVKSLDDITITTQCESGSLNLLMFRDSFTNMLIPLIANEFANATFSRATPYNYKQLESIDVVIEEIAERNLKNIIDKAPLMPTLETELNESLTQTDMDISISIEEHGDYWKIVGIAKLINHNPYSNYDIFIRINANGSSSDFIPFPIFEQGYFNGSEGDANAAFSMIIEKSLVNEESIIEVIIFDKDKYFVDQAAKEDGFLFQAE